MDLAHNDLKRVQFGCGLDAPDGWLNFDASPSVWLESLPLIGWLLRVKGRRFPASVRFGDIVRGLPVADNSASAVYASHVLEHLAYDDFGTALRNTYRILKPGGVFRFIVPDLRARAELYLARTSSGDPDAAKSFMTNSHLGLTQQPRTLASRVRTLLGHSAHLWMWDEPAVCDFLKKVGFVDIRRCHFGDAEDVAFQQVECRERFHNERLDIEEVAIEARKPLR